MAESNSRGPVTSMGALEQQNSTQASVEIFDGPSIFYQGIGLADVLNGFPFAKDGTAPARQPGFVGAPALIAIDAVPQTFSSTAIAASQSLATTGSVAVALVTAGLTNPTVNSQFIAVNVPIRPFGTSSIATAAIAIDFGFTTATTTNNSTTYFVPDNTLFNVGQWVAVGNAGNSTAGTTYFAQVLGISTSNFTTITLSVAAGTGMCAPVGQAALHGSGLLPSGGQIGGPVPATPNRVLPNSFAGLMGAWNPREMLARGVYATVTPLVATSGTYTVVVSGWDIYGQPMTETLTRTLATTTATTLFGAKAFKYINTVTASVLQTTATVSIGISDVFGLPLRADVAQHIEAWAGNTAIANTVGFTAAVSTAGNPATSTTGDVRGTLQVSGIGGGTAISAPATTSGSLRLFIVQDIGTWNNLAATPLNTVPLFGVKQA